MYSSHAPEIVTLRSRLSIDRFIQFQVLLTRSVFELVNRTCFETKQPDGSGEIRSTIKEVGHLDAIVKHLNKFDSINFKNMLEIGKTPHDLPALIAAALSTLVLG